ncbi:MAG: hypothetical protein MW690_001114 [Methanophagales archaeon]|nr:hypothetical protein [Methanophagales archaeon]
MIDGASDNSGHTASLHFAHKAHISASRRANEMIVRTMRIR